MLPALAGNYLGHKRCKYGWDEEGWYIELIGFSGGTHSFHAETETDARA